MHTLAQVFASASVANKQGIGGEPPLLKIMKTPAKARKKPLDGKKSRTLVDKKEKKKETMKWKKAQKKKRSKQNEKKDKQFLKNQKRRKQKALDSGRKYTPRATSHARVLLIASTGLSMAKDAKKVSLEAKMDAKQAHKVSEETLAAQDQFMIQYDTRLQDMERVLQAGDLIDAEGALIASETPSPRCAADCEKSTHLGRHALRHPLLNGWLCREGCQN